AELAEIFTAWNAGELNSFLIEITAEVLRRVDPGTGAAFVDVVRDEAEQKGTGRWTVESGLALGVPISGIAEAVFARAVSGAADQRAAVRAARGTARPATQVTDRAAFIESVRQALYAAKVIAYAQGLDLIRAASAEYGWDVDLAAMATIWRGGCIIRAELLDRIAAAYRADPKLASLVVDASLSQAVQDAEPASRQAGSHGVRSPV